MASSAIESVLGKTVKVVTAECVYIGVLFNADANEGRLSLRNVTVGEDDEELNHVLHLYKHDILNLDILDTRRTTGNTRSFLSRKKHKPRHLEEMRQQWLIESSTTKKNPSDSVGTSHKYRVIDALDQQFHDAMAYIKTLTIVSVSVKGRELGRFGQLCWLNIAAGDEILLFDIVSLGRQCFTQGMSDVLSDPHILKVMHDCRQPSDLFLHQYNTELRNIFDTQVADIFIDRDRHSGTWPRYTQGLPCCLLSHLDLQPSEVNVARVRQHCHQDEGVWAERPCPLLSEAVKDVVHLRRLRVVLVEKMMSEYTRCVDVYLNYTRRAVERDARSRRAEGHLVPREFQDASDEKLWRQRRTPKDAVDRRRDGHTRGVEGGHTRGAVEGGHTRGVEGLHTRAEGGHTRAVEGGHTQGVEGKLMADHGSTNNGVDHRWKNDGGPSRVLGEGDGKRAGISDGDERGESGYSETRRIDGDEDHGRSEKQRSGSEGGLMARINELTVDPTPNVIADEKGDNSRSSHDNFDNADNLDPIDPKQVLAAAMKKSMADPTPRGHLILRPCNYNRTAPAQRVTKGVRPKTVGSQGERRCISDHNHTTHSNGQPSYHSNQNSSRHSSAQLHNTVGVICRNENSVSFQKFGRKPLRTSTA